MPDVLTQAENLLKDIQSVPNAAGTLIDNGNTLIEHVYKAGGSAVTEGMSEADRLAADGAIQELAEISKFAHGIAVFNVLTGLVQVRTWIKQLADRMPRVIGKPLSHMADFFIFPIEGEAEKLFQTLTAQSKHIVHSHIRSTGWAARESGLLQELLSGTVLQQPISLKGTGPGPTQTPNYATQSDIAALNHRINALSYALGVEEHKQVIPPSLAPELRGMQAEITALRNATASLVSQQEKLQDTTESLQNQINTLTHELGGLRQIQVGWSDVVEELNKTRAGVDALRAQTVPQLHQNTQAIHHLAPLGLLLEAGIVGLKVLRQLEDTPCMCPKFANIPNELGTALAVVEWVENG